MAIAQALWDEGVQLVELLTGRTVAPETKVSLFVVPLVYDVTDPVERLTLVQQVEARRRASIRNCEKH